MNILNLPALVSLSLFFGTLATQASASVVTAFEQISPTSVEYVLNTDYTVAEGTGFGDITATVLAWDPPGSSLTAGCGTSPYASGYFSGNIALIERGGCYFREKVENAITIGGATGVILYNSAGGGSGTGVPGGLFTGSLISPAFPDPTTIPVFFTSYDFGVSLYNLYIDFITKVGPAPVVRMSVSAVPVPAVMGLLGIGLLAFRVGRRRPGKK